MLQPLLTGSQTDLLRTEKFALAELQSALAALDLPRTSLETLRDAVLQLDELFLIIVIGEFNAGKSALVNAILGERVLPEGPTPTTSRVTLAKWGETIGERIVDESFSVVTHPNALLRTLNVVDTPGTNAVIREHERLTVEFMPRSDLVLFVTSADHPMTESERQLLEHIKVWGKKVIVALNKVDILENEAAVAEVRDFVLKHMERALGVVPELFPVSARLAQWAGAESDPDKRAWLLKSSRIDALAEYVRSVLDDRTRLQLKLSNPLGVADHIVQEAIERARKQSESLELDRETVVELEGLASIFERELGGELEPRLSQVDNILQRMQQRGLDFFDTTLRLTNIAQLVHGDRVRAAFESRVLDDVPAQISNSVQQLIDWVVERNQSHWQQVMVYLRKRQSQHTDQITGEAMASLDARRRTLIDSVGHTAQVIVETYDRDQEAHDLAVGVEMAVAQVALLEAGAVGLGAWVVTVIATSAADITGLLAAGTLAIVGLFIIPYKRNQAKERFRSRIAELRSKLMDSLRSQFKAEVDRTLGRIREGIAPYTRFVRAEAERCQAQQVQLEEISRRISALKAQIQTL